MYEFESGSCSEATRLSRVVISRVQRGLKECLEGLNRGYSNVCSVRD